MEVKVTVTLQAEPDDLEARLEPSEARSACVEAVTRALELAEENGFSHKLADSISIGVVEVN